MRNAWSFGLAVAVVLAVRGGVPCGGPYQWALENTFGAGTPIPGATSP